MLLEIIHDPNFILFGINFTNFTIVLYGNFPFKLEIGCTALLVKMLRLYQKSSCLSKNRVSEISTNTAKLQKKTYSCSQFIALSLILYLGITITTVMVCTLHKYFKL